MITGLGYSIKPGAVFSEGVVSPDILYAAQVAEGVYAGFGYPLTVTSGMDSTHMEGSYHYSGDAMDLRTNNLPPGISTQIAQSLQAALGGGYRVILESDHIHVQLTARSGFQDLPPSPYYPLPEPGSSGGSGSGGSPPVEEGSSNWMLYGGIAAAAALAYATLSR